MYKTTNPRSSISRIILSIVIAFVCIVLPISAFTENNNLETYPVKAGEFADVLKAAQEGDVTQQVTLGRMYSNGTGVTKDLSQSVIWFRKAAEQGNTRGQAYLGIAYLNGAGGLNKDFVRALDLIQKSADQNDAVGQALLGAMHERGLAKDLTHALTWYRKSVDQGNARGQTYLGAAYFAGRGGLIKNDIEAANLFRKAAEQGYAEGQSRFGFMLQFGLGVTRDERQAMSWYQKAADQGNVSGQFNLGVMYETALGIEKDERQALFWYNKAADQDSTNAQFKLANIYANGLGVPKNERAAIDLYRKAAVKGHTKSQGHLAHAYSLGLSGEVKNSLAYFWNLIISNNNYESSLVKLLEPLLPSAGQLEIKKIALEWKVGSPEPVLKFYDVLTTRVEPQPAPYITPVIPVPRAASPAPSIPNMPAPSGSAKSTGSGFRVSSNQVVTNAHVVVGCSRLRVNGLAANFQVSDSQVDLALINVNGLAGTIASIRNDIVRVGEDVAAAGYPLRGLLSGFNITRGNVSSLTGLGGDRRVFQITAPVQPGNSGGPLVDGAGNVAGVIVSKLSWKAAFALNDIPQNVNFAVNLSSLQTFLKANSVRYQAAGTNSSQFSLPDVAEQAKHYTALVECL